MKRIGILYDKDSKKVFLLPEDVKVLTSEGIVVNIASGLGKSIGINDSAYLMAGAKIFESWSSLIEASDVILKTNAFNKAEIKKMSKKIAITMTHYLSNVDMLFEMLQNNVTGLEWSSLNDHNGYVFFPQLEELKAPFIMKEIAARLEKNKTLKPKEKLTVLDKPHMLIVNATFAGVALAKLALDAGYEVTLADNDLKYCRELKASGLSRLNIIDGNYDTIDLQSRDNHILVTTSIDPVIRTKTRITKQMAQAMPQGSLLVDAGCQNGYAFHFIKKFATKKVEWVKQDKFFYLAIADITDLMPNEASNIISRKSVSYLNTIAKDGLTNQFSKITICEKGEVVNSFVNKVLNLY